jgi:hypothetical protein
MPQALPFSQFVFKVIAGGFSAVHGQIEPADQGSDQPKVADGKHPKFGTRRWGHE